LGLLSSTLKMISLPPTREITSSPHVRTCGIIDSGNPSGKDEKKVAFIKETHRPKAMTSGTPLKTTFNTNDAPEEQTPMTSQRNVTPSSSANKKKFRTDQSIQWNQRFIELQIYKKAYGHCNVPRTYLQNPQLGTWINTQRKQYRLLQLGQNSQMTHDRIIKLEQLGFVWSKCGKSDWSMRFQELKEYKKEFGDCLVPQRYGPNPQLGTWVNNQRTQYRTFNEDGLGPMTSERVQMLEGIGFVWNVTKRIQKRNRAAEHMEAEASNYKRRSDYSTATPMDALASLSEARLDEQNKENFGSKISIRFNQEVDAATQAAAAVLIEM